MTVWRAGVVGVGFIGKVHIEALRRLGNVEVLAIAGTSPDRAAAQAAALGVPRAYGDWEALLADPDVDVVHICTPNSLHYPIASAAIRAGKAVLIEKPLAMTAEEANHLVALAAEHGRVAGVCFNHRMYPLIQQMRAMVRAGDVGAVRIAHGGYFQDWLMYDTDWNWRLQPELSGRSRALADIGSHWCDTFEYVTGQQIVAVCADIATLLPHRHKPAGPVETFSTSTASGETVAVETEDYASVLFRLSNGGHGVFTVSQASPGRRNRLSLEISGSQASIAWDQEVPQHLWVGRRGRPSETVVRDISMLHPDAQPYVHYPPGHEEAWADVWKNLMREFYADVAAGQTTPGRYATVKEGQRMMVLLEAILGSAAAGAWVDVAHP